MANVTQGLAVALGATSPGTPTTEAAFRTARNALQTLFIAMVPAQQPLVPQPSVVGPPPPVVPVPPPTPLQGGLTQVNNNMVTWSGGGTTVLICINQPASSLAYRPNDLSLALKVEKACTQGLPETRRLPVPGIVDTQNALASVKFADWNYRLKNAMIERGSDSVVCADIDGVEVFLLEKWGKATKTNIDAHVDHLQVNGDEYDCKNLKLLAKFILNSLDNEMLRRTEHELGATATGRRQDLTCMQQ
jgi:hypothetical protein